MRPGVCQTGEQTATHLEIPPLFIDGDDKLIDVSDQLVALCLPKSICTLLQQLHQHILIKEEGPGTGDYGEPAIALLVECVTQRLLVVEFIMHNF